MGDSSELDELRLHVVLVTKADQGALVAHLVTVVGGAEHGDALAIVLHDVAFILHLVGPHHQLQIIGAQEVLCDVRAERKPNTSLRRTLAHLGLGVCGEAESAERCDRRKELATYQTREDQT